MDGVPEPEPEAAAAAAEEGQNSFYGRLVLGKCLRVETTEMNTNSFKFLKFLNLAPAQVV